MRPFPRESGLKAGSRAINLLTSAPSHTQRERDSEAQNGYVGVAGHQLGFKGTENDTRKGTQKRHTLFRSRVMFDSLSGTREILEAFHPGAERGTQQIFCCASVSCLRILNEVRAPWNGFPHPTGARACCPHRWRTLKMKNVLRLKNEARCAIFGVVKIGSARMGTRACFSLSIPAPSFYPEIVI